MRRHGIDTEKRMSYFDLIPQSSNSLLHEPRLRHKHLLLLEFILQESINAIDCLFKQRQYERFDPHVGDTLCQIRAAHIIYLANNPGFNVTECMSYLSNVLLKVKLLLPVVEKSIKIKRSPEVRKKEDSQTLAEFLKERQIYFEVPATVDYVTKVYLLTKFKSHPLGELPQIRFNKLCECAHISKDLAVRIVRYWQISLSQYSCNYIEWMENDHVSLARFLKAYDDNHRSVLPCYFVMQQIIKYLYAYNVDVLLIIRNPDVESIKPLMMRFETHGGRFTLSTDLDTDKPHFTLHAVSSALVYPEKETKGVLHKKVIKHGLQKILLASVANHPQYCGLRLSELNEKVYQHDQQSNSDRKSLSQVTALNILNQQYHDLVEFAKQEGCDLKKPSFIFIEHILVGAIKSQMAIFGMNETYFVGKMRYNQVIKNINHHALHI